MQPTVGGKKCTASCLDQVDCVVDERVGQAEPTTVDKCTTDLFNPGTKDCGAAGAGCPCWRIIPNSECVPARDGSPYGLQILRPTGVQAQKGAIAEARCATSLAGWGTADFLALPQCQ